MIAIITFFSRAVNHSISGPAGTRYAARPVAMQRLGLARLIRRLPGEIVLPRVQFAPPSQPGVYLHFHILDAPLSLNSLGFSLQVNPTKLLTPFFFFFCTSATLRSFQMNPKVRRSLFCLPYRVESSQNHSKTQNYIGN